MGLKVSNKRFVLSDQTKNLYGFITITAGIDLSAFTENPVMLYNHDYEKAIGQIVDFRVEGTKLTGAPAFDEDDAFAMQCFNKVESDILKGMSIGLSPVKFNEKTSEMAQCLLLEVSLTPVPNNRKALAIYSSKGQKLNASEIPQYLLSVERTDNPITTNQNMNKKFLTALVALCVQAGQTVNLTAESNEDEIEGTIKKVGEKLTALSDANVQLTADKDKLEKTHADALDKEIDDFLADAVNEKYLTAAEVPALKKFGKTDLSAMKTMVKGRRPATLVTLPTNPAKKDAPAGRETWGWDEYSLNAPDELSAMETVDPDKYKLLLSAKQTQARQKFSIEA